MKSYLIIALSCLASILLSSCSKPENKLVSHIQSVDKIMRDNMDTTKAGVDKLIAYAEKNGPEAANIFVGLGVELAKIEGDGDREKRAKVIKDAFETPIKNFSGTAKKFGDKVSADSESRRRLEEYGKRWESLGRLLDLNKLDFPF